MTKYACPCCGFITLDEVPPGSFSICPVCFWEDDFVQFDEPDYKGGANKVSLNQAKNNFKEYGASSEEFMKEVRVPYQNEVPYKGTQDGVAIPWAKKGQVFKSYDFVDLSIDKNGSVTTKIFGQKLPKSVLGIRKIWKYKVYGGEWLNNKPDEGWAPIFRKAGAK